MSLPSPDTAAAVALYLLKGKKITRVAADKPKRLTDKQWRRRIMDDRNETVDANGR